MAGATSATATSARFHGDMTVSGLIRFRISLTVPDSTSRHATVCRMSIRCLRWVPPPGPLYCVTVTYWP
jgi:hypothetical protein